MRTERISIAYRLTFESAFHFGTGLSGGLVDRLVSRDADGFLYVPGSTVKGLLRERCEHLAEMLGLETTSPHVEAWREADWRNPDIVARIFGTRFLPGQIYFDDSYMIDEDRVLFETDDPERVSELRAWQTEQRTQVSISRRTRTAEPGLLRTSEYGIRDLRFEGRIAGVLTGTPLVESEDVGTFPLLLLVASLLSLERAGGHKSRGAGKLIAEITGPGPMIDDQDLPVEQLLEELPFFELYDEWREEITG